MMYAFTVAVLVIAAGICLGFFMNLVDKWRGERCATGIDSPLCSCQSCKEVHKPTENA